MIPNYQVRFRDHYGELTHVLASAGAAGAGLVSLSYENVVNGTGSHTIAIKGDLSISLQVGLDYQVEIWRMPVGSRTWIKAYEGFHRTWTWQADNDGEEQFIGYGSGCNSLLARRIIDAYAGTAQANKSGPAETVIKAYVNENLGPGAAANRAAPGLTIQTDGSSGYNWEGGRSRKALLEVCQEIAKAGGGDFSIVGTGPATFEFRWYPGQMGVDRTLGNTAGNDPVIFSLQRNNMLRPVLSLNHGQEVNCVYVLGRGEGSDREVIAVTDLDAIGASPWARCEATRQATNESTVDGLVAVGASELVQSAARQSVSFEVAQNPSCAYGVHYNLGDIVTALFHQRVDKKVVKVGVSASDKGEAVKVELADVA